MAEHIVKALSAFVSEHKGAPLDVKEGDLFETDHPFVKKHPELFGPISFRFPTSGRVEQATAAPGEKRTLSLRRKPRKATAAEEAGIAATIEAEKPEPEPEPEPAPVGRAMTTDSYRGRG